MYSRNYLICITTLLLAACGGGNQGDGQPSNVVGGGEARISGLIAVSGNSSVDADIAIDENGRNNSFSTAQAQRNPVTIGGYVRVQGQGCLPNVPFDDDTAGGGGGGSSSDMYSVQLFADQMVELVIADKGRGDLDLYLHDANRQPVLRSISAASNEAVVVPADGDYFIEVCSFSGASNYVLGIGQSSSSSSASTVSEAALVPGEVIVRWKTPANKQSMSRSGLAKTGVTLLQHSEHADLVSLAPDQRVRSALSVKATRMMIKELAARPEVEWAVPNYRVQPNLEPNDPRYASQWHYGQISLPEAWDVTVGDNAVTVAVIDTGVLMTHPDLQGQFQGADPDGYDFVADVSNSGDGDGIDGNANDPGDNSPGGSSFHGTHVAGTVAAATDNSEGIGGVSWASRIMPIRVLGLDGGTSFDVQQGMLYAAGLDSVAPSPPSQPAKILNLSLGGGPCTAADQDAINRIRAAGSIIIAAAGNERSEFLGAPANCEGVVAVGATTITNRRAFYSNFGDDLDLVAPGGDTSADIDGDGNPDGVLSTRAAVGANGLNFTYDFLQGTSMAAPHVAGVASLMMALHPGLSPSDFDALIESGTITDDLGVPGRDENFGHGLIDARKAIEQANQLANGAPLPEPPPRVLASPGALSFGAFGEQLEFELTNSGGGTVVTVQQSDDASWLTVAASETAANGLGRYQASVNRAGLEDGSYQGQIEITAQVLDGNGALSSQTFEMSVLMQVGQEFGADAGRHIVLLVDDATGDVVAADEVLADEGFYDYEFLQVPDGRYRVVAGTDNDNDRIICDNGEACGAFLTLDQPAPVDVSNGVSRSSINFTSGYGQAFNASSNASAAGIRLAEQKQR